jgi:hypothetical protein
MKKLRMLHSATFIDETGNRHGFLRVLRFVGREKAGNCRWLCKCDCGEFTTVRGTHLRCGQVRSCGHLQKHRTHGASKLPEYRIWASAKQRITNPNNKDFKYYGGRGLKWGFVSFMAFLADVGLRPSKRHTLDRIKNNRGYVPRNMRWVFSGTNNSNRRAARLAGKKAACNSGNSRKFI